MDLVGCLRSFDKLRARASAPELIFPGHDVLMHDDYPLVADGVTQLV
jgi:hypothetical protein